MITRLIPIAMLFFSIGCTEKVNETSNSLSGVSKLYLAVECENSSNINLKVSEFFPQDARAVPCEVVGKRKAYFSDDQLKIKFLKKDFASIQYNCLDPDKHKEFFTKYNGKSVVLVYDGKLLHSFVANGAGKESKCGELLVFSYEDAVNMCSALADARGESLENCAMLCSEKKSKICLDN